MTSLRAEIKTELRHNVCDNVTVKEKYNIQCKIKRYSLITVLSLMLFWITDFLQTDYILKMMFCDVNSIVMIIKQAFSIKSVNNDSSAAWESRDKI